MNSYVKGLAKDLVLVQHRELIKEYCVQSDVDFFVIKELKLKAQALESELKNITGAYESSVKEREFLIEKVHILRTELAKKPVAQPKDCSKAEAKYNDLLKDTLELIRLQGNYMATYNSRIKDQYTAFLNQYKLKHVKK